MKEICAKICINTEQLHFENYSNCLQVMKTISSVLVLFKLFNLTFCLVTPVFYDGNFKNSLKLLVLINLIFPEIKDCSKEMEVAGGIADLSKFQIISTDDTHTYINGTIKFNADIKQPWKAKLFSEKYDRGQWVVDILDRNVDDACQKMTDPMSPLYMYEYDQPRCPIKPGVNLLINK